MPKAKFYYGTKGQLDDKNIENGALYMTTDEEKWYVDMDGERHLLSQGTEFEDRIVFDGSVPFSGILTLNGYPAIPLFTFEYAEGEELENQAIGYTVKVYLKDEDHSPNGYIYWAGAIHHSIRSWNSFTFNFREQRRYTFDIWPLVRRSD